MVNEDISDNNGEDENNEDNEGNTDDDISECMRKMKEWLTESFNLDKHKNIINFYR